jgi:hypothetical protein
MSPQQPPDRLLGLPLARLLGSFEPSSDDHITGRGISDRQRCKQDLDSDA